MHVRRNACIHARTPIPSTCIYRKSNKWISFDCYWTIDLIKSNCIFHIRSILLLYIFLLNHSLYTLLCTWKRCENQPEKKKCVCARKKEKSVGWISLCPYCYHRWVEMNFKRWCCQFKVFRLWWKLTLTFAYTHFNFMHHWDALDATNLLIFLCSSRLLFYSQVLQLFDSHIDQSSCG